MDWLESTEQKLRHRNQQLKISEDHPIDLKWELLQEGMHWMIMLRVRCKICCYSNFAFDLPDIDIEEELALVYSIKGNLPNCPHADDMITMILLTHMETH